MRQRETYLSRAQPQRRIWLLLLLSIFVVGAANASQSASLDDNNDRNEEATCVVDEQQRQPQQQQKQAPVPEECRMVMAPSVIPNAGWGVFSLLDMQRGQRVLSGDVVVHLTDLGDSGVRNDSGMQLALHDYLWSSEETFGFYEGIKVTSVLPGIGMLANGKAGGKHNVLPATPMVDEGGLTRQGSAGAGSITHYHNYTFFVFRNITAGHEILVNYGQEWFQERHDRLEHNVETEERNVDWLRQHGLCLDNVKPGRSTMSDVGRGAFSARDLPAGSVVAPVPVLPLKRDTMLMARQREDESMIEIKQLLLNYCFGHNKSSLLLYPYGPNVNLVNHHDKHANVRLQWSTSTTFYNHSDPSWFQSLSLDELFSAQLLPNRTGILMELVALRPIRRGEEILLNYGNEWADAWRTHVKHWQPVAGASAYAPSYVMDDVIKVLRTEKELKVHPYPENVFTSCFYKYTDNAQTAQQPQPKQDADSVTAFRWKLTRGLFEPRNLRPCSILQRTEESDGQTSFTVRIRNRYGLDSSERIPKGETHIVTHVPRQALRFSDKIYTSDQHLSNAFRHEIGMPDDLFPEQWKDLDDVASTGSSTASKTK